MKNIIRIAFICILYLFFHSANGQTQTPDGIQFIRSNSLNQLTRKAKEEGKYIFIDCYTTWCGPCKQMEQTTYNKKNVGDFMNRHFISIKMQMDTTKNDDPQVKIWYKEAQDISKNYEVNEFPTYLFLGQNGQIVHKSFGYKDSADFIHLGNEALDSNLQYYTMYSKFQHDKLKESTQIKYLARKAKELGYETEANTIANKYFEQFYINYDSVLTNKDDLLFITEFVTSSSGKAFNFLYTNAKSVNNALGFSEYVEDVITNIITREIVNPLLKDSKKETPNWQLIQNIINKRFSKYYSDRASLLAMLNWNSQNKNWKNYTKNLIEYVEKYLNNLNWFSMNNNAWTIFTYSNNKKELSIALQWAAKAIEQGPKNYSNSVDTYANILYKLERVPEAISWEEKAVRLAEDQKDYDNLTLYNEALAKMKNRIATWPTLTAN